MESTLSDVKEYFSFLLTTLKRKLTADQFVYHEFSGDSDGGNVSPVRARNRRRRAAFGAVHFQKEKFYKQITVVLDRHDAHDLEYIINNVDLSELEGYSYNGDWPFLHQACAQNSTDKVAVLLRHGASVNQFGHSPYAALHIACQHNCTPMVALLLSHGAKVNNLTKYEFKSPLHLAAHADNAEIIQLLLQNGAKVGLRDIYGETPLHIVCRLGSAAILKLLIKYSANVDEYNVDGWTGLHLAAASGHYDVIITLLDNRANIDAQTKYGRTALSWACAMNYSKIVSELLNRGANANIADLNNKLAFQYSTHNALTSMVKKHAENSKESTTVSTIGLYVEIDQRRNSVFVRHKNELTEMIKWWRQDCQDKHCDVITEEDTPPGETLFEKEQD